VHGVQITLTLIYKVIHTFTIKPDLRENTITLPVKYNLICVTTESWSKKTWSPTHTVQMSCFTYTESKCWYLQQKMVQCKSYKWSPVPL